MMTAYIFTPKILIQQIKKFAMENNIQFFVMSSNLHGGAYAPSKKTPLYRVPVAIPEIFTESNLSKMTKGFYFVGLNEVDVSKLSEQAMAESKKALEREAREEDD